MQVMKRIIMVFNVTVSMVTLAFFLVSSPQLFSVVFAKTSRKTETVSKTSCLQRG